jgi:hypothetical protein
MNVYDRSTKDTDEHHHTTTPQPWDRPSASKLRFCQHWSIGQVAADIFPWLRRIILPHMKGCQMCEDMMVLRKLN